MAGPVILTLQDRVDLARAPRKRDYLTPQQRAFDDERRRVSRENAWMAVPALAPAAVPFLVEAAPVAGALVSRGARYVAKGAERLIDSVTGRPVVGQKIYRVYGERPMKPQDAQPFGRSWTRTDPSRVRNYRDAAGLPEESAGRFVVEGRLASTAGVRTRRALPLGGRRGGLDEVVIPDPRTGVTVERVSGVNPNY